MDAPNVLVAVPILNEVNFIEDALYSLQNQTFKNIQVVIIDGGSTDGTVDILQRFPFEYHVIPGLGQMACINKVWKEYEAKYVTWMAGDDILYENAFQELVEVLENNPEASFAHGPADVIDAKNRIIFHRQAKNIYLEDLLKSYCMLPQTGLIRRTCLDYSGFTNENLRLAADHDLYLRLSIFGRGVCVNRTIAKFRIHSLSEDAKNFADVGRQTIRVVESVISNPNLIHLFQKNHIRIGRSHSRIVAANFIHTAGNRLEAFSLFLEAFRINPKILVDNKTLRLLIRLISPILIPPNFLRKIKFRLIHLFN